MQKPRNRKSQRAKITSSIYLQYVLHWIYFITFFLQKSFAKMTLLQNIYFYLRSHWEKFCFSFMAFTFCSKGLKGHKLIQVPHANFSTFLTTFGHSFCLRYQIHGNSEKLSHIFWRIFGALLMHCSFFFLQFTNSAKIHKKMRKIFWISKIVKLVKLLASET